MPGAESERQRGVFLTRVARNEPICREHWRLVLEAEGFPPAQPGQFVQILCAEPGDSGWTQGPFIRRPFSIGGLRRSGNRCEMDILHRAIGPGTRWLSRLEPGREVSVLGPLGTPFAVHPRRTTALLAGGGIGLPPLIWLAETLAARGHRVIAFCGARTAELLPLTRLEGVAVSGEEGSPAFAEFAPFGVPVVVSTDDGSLGLAGRVPDALERYLVRHEGVASSSALYSCGPDPMMRAVARIGLERDIPTQVCLERVMACGMGTCQSCVVKVHDAAAEDGWRYRLCCTDGPAFDAREVAWE